MSAPRRAPSSSSRRLVVVLIGVLLALGLTTAATAGPPTPLDHDPGSSAPRVESLDRGLVAATTDEGVFLSWRLLGDEVTGHTPDGMTGPSFRVHRDGQLLATVTDSTNHLDPGGDAGSTYTVTPVVDGRAGARSAAVRPWADAHTEVPLNRPPDGVTPVGEAYTYSANDLSVADLDGDGQYEYIVKWDPSNSKDVSQKGYTGNVYVDAYEADGTQLWRIDLGVNIRAGAHYTQFPVYDFDGDGRAEVMMKTAPGTTITRYNPSGRETSTRDLRIPVADRRLGVTPDSDYRFSAEDYHDYLVEVFMDWHEHEEVVSGQWPDTLEEAFGIEPAHDYPLSRADATALVDHFMDVYAPSRSARNELRDFEGFVITGPEYLTVFDGHTGWELQTIDYKPPRGDDGLLWGDYALSRIEPGNRVDRFLSGVGYLDGTIPSAIFARGYYTRTTIVAYDWDGRRLHERWYVDSGHVPMDNPFDYSVHQQDGTDPEFGEITTQGFHSLSVADVDADGRHEVVYGAATIDHDGSLLYSTFDEMPRPPGSDDPPGPFERLGHGDAMHVTDIDPDRPGLEFFGVFEGGQWVPYGMALRDAATGKVVYGEYTGRDTGRGMIGDVRPDVPGIETWAIDLRSASGEILAIPTPQSPLPGTNMSVRWAADGTTQIINGSGNATPTIDDWTRGRLRTLEGTRTNNGTKGNPGLVADVLGDWREEVLVRTTDSSAIQVHLSTEVTDIKLHTLMHDPQYRAEVARQQTTYNQPSYPGFYLASDTDFTTVPVPEVEIVRACPGRGAGAGVCGGR